MEVHRKGVDAAHLVIGRRVWVACLKITGTTRNPKQEVDMCEKCLHIISPWNLCSMLRGGGGWYTST